MFYPLLFLLYSFYSLSYYNNTVEIKKYRCHCLSSLDLFWLKSYQWNLFLSSLATVHIQERIGVVSLHCDSIIKLHTWKCKKGPNMSRRGTNASPSEYSASMPLQLHWMLNHVLEVHWGTHTYRCSTAVMSNLSHNTFAPYHWPQPLVLFSQGGRSNTSRSYWRQNAAERCIRSYWAGGYHGSIGATLKCATADQN